MIIRTSIALIMALLLPAQAIHASVEFSGFLQADGTLRFVLTERTNRNTSGWLSIGDSYAGYTILAYRPDDEILILHNGGGEVLLPLRSSRVNPGANQDAQGMKEPQGRQNTIRLRISESGTIHDIQEVKLRLGAMRPSLRGVIYSDMQLPDNAPRDPKRIHAFLVPAMLAFEAICSEVDLRPAGGSIKVPTRIDQP